MKKAAIYTENLSVGYDSKPVLSELGLSLGRGSLTALIGANGSGKSTLLRTLVGLQPPVSGHVSVEGHRLEDMTRREVARHISTVFTDRNGGGGLTVAEVVATGRFPYTGVFGRLSGLDRDIVDRSLSQVGMLGKSSRYLGSLSDGERQKTMIAAALAQQTSIIILDEPTAFLDVAGRHEILHLLKELAASGRSILLSTHDVGATLAVADSAWVVDPTSATVVQGTVQEILEGGILDTAFSSLRFDPVRGDFIW